jgi:hypothetical protein
MDRVSRDQSPPPSAGCKKLQVRTCKSPYILMVLVISKLELNFHFCILCGNRPGLHVSVSVSK